MNTELTSSSVTDLLRLLDSGEVTAVSLIEAYLSRIAAESSLNALTTVFGSEALAEAESQDAASARGERLGPLAGIPITIKDSIPTAGLLTTCNSRSRENWVPTTEPLSVTRVREAGAIVLAKATPNEFLGIPSADDLFPPPRNPFNRDHVAIGSSSGSGVAVAAGLCAASIGTDSAGSVRLPAGQNGLTGLKATRGRVPSSSGAVEPTLQVIGALTRTVDDSRLLFEVLTGSSPTSVTADVSDRSSDQASSISSAPRIGVPRRYIETSPVEDEIGAAFDAALSSAEAAGARLLDVRPRGWAEGRMATFVVLYTEAHFSHRAWLKRAGGGYGRSARLYSLQGAFISASDYLHSLAYGNHLRDSVEALFDEVDVIATPTSPYVTAEAARRPGEHRKGLNTVFTGVFNLTGHPAVTIDCGRSASGIPIGLQLVGRLGSDEQLLAYAKAVSDAIGG